MTKGKIIKGTILFLIYVFVLAFLIWYISDNKEIISRIMEASTIDVLGVALCTLLCTALAGIMDITCARVYGVKIGYFESFSLTCMASAVNMILPLQLGGVSKAIYLKRKLALAYSKYVSIISGTTIIGIFVSIFQVIVCMVAVTYRTEEGAIYALVCTIIFSATLGVLLLSIHKQEFIIRIVPFKNISVPIIEGFFSLIGNKRVVCLISLNLIASSFLGGIRFLLIFRMIGFYGGIMDSLLYFGLYNASTIVPIIPGNVGISEFIVGAMNSLLGSDFDIGVATVLINRVFYYIVSMIGAIVSAPILILKLKKE